MFDETESISPLNTKSTTTLEDLEDSSFLFSILDMPNFLAFVAFNYLALEFPSSPDRFFISLSSFHVPNNPLLPTLHQNPQLNSFVSVGSIPTRFLKFLLIPKFTIRKGGLSPSVYRKPEERSRASSLYLHPRMLYQFIILECYINS